MSLTRPALMTLALGLVLTWLLYCSLAPTDRQYVAVQKALVGISVGEAELRSDVLSAHGGLLRNDDPINAHVSQLHEAMAALRRAAHGDAAEPIARLAETLDKQERLIEDLKSSNASLQNSLTSFTRLSAKLADTGAVSKLAADTDALTAAMLLLSRDGNPEAIAMVRRQLNALALQPATTPFEADAASLVLQGSLLATLIPKVDDLVAAFPSFLTFDLRRDVRSVFAGRRDALERRSDHYQMAMFGVAILFLGTLLAFGRRLRRSAVALREHSEIEHQLARISNDFIGVQPEDIRAKIAQSLARLGSKVENDRTYIISVRDDFDDLIWNRPGAECPVGWPEAIRDVIPDLIADDGEVFSTTGYGKPPPIAVTRLLARFNRACWSCVKLDDQGELAGFLIFERQVSRPAWYSDMEDLIRLAGVTMSNAMQRERMFRQRLALIEQVHRAKRLEVVGLFASGIAHNFNNLLGVILGHAEIAAEHLEERSTAARSARQIIQACGRARALVENITSYGRRNEGRLQPIAIREMLNDTANLLRPSLEVPLELDIRLPTENVFVSGTPAQFQQVLVNLIRNAAQASLAGTSVVVSAEAGDHRRPTTCTHGTLAPGAYVRIGVTDKGTGIPDSVKARLFEPFFTTRPAGTGLGLATAAEVIRDLQGAIDLESMPGEGTTFHVLLPVYGPAARPATPPGRGEVVMVVGRNVASVADFEDLLAAAGYEPVGVHTAAAALAALEADPQRFDVMLIGGDLADMTGVDLVRQIRRAGEHLAVGLICFKPGEADRRLTDSCDAIVPYPPSPGGIADTVLQLLRVRSGKTHLGSTAPRVSALYLSDAIGPAQTGRPRPAPVG